MCKRDFLEQLRGRLSGLPREDLEERLAFYHEMIDDRMEEGLSEEEAVQAVGTLEEIVAQILEESAAGNSQPESTPAKRKMKAWEIVLLVLGAPVWFSLLIAAVSVLFSVYVTVWAGVISLWAVFVSVAACGLTGIISALIYMFGAETFVGVAAIGASFVCLGLAFYLLCGSKAATEAMLTFTKKAIVAIRHRFTGKEWAI